MQNVLKGLSHSPFSHEVAPASGVKLTVGAYGADPTACCSDAHSAWQKIKIALIVLAILWMIMGAGFIRTAHTAGPDTAANPYNLLKDPDFQPRLGTYYYCFEFNSMNIGAASIGIQREGDYYKMAVFAKTNETIDYVFKIRYRGENITDLDPLLSPVETKIQQTVKSKQKEIDIRFQNNGTIQTYEKELQKGKVVDGEVRKMNPGRFTVDPFSATYLARALDWKPGAVQVFDVYTGKGRYELSLKCIGRASVEMPGGRRDAWVIAPTARQVDDEGRRVELKKKQPDVKIYISADELKDVLRIEGNHAIGTFLAVLERFEPAQIPGKKIASQSEARPAPYAGQ